MKEFWFSKSVSEWQSWVLMLSGFVLGGGHYFWWAGILLAGAFIEGIFGND
jgi:hypothetical protein